jgi:hypothetical protein
MAWYLVKHMDNFTFTSAFDLQQANPLPEINNGAIFRSRKVRVLILL